MNRSSFLLAVFAVAFLQQVNAQQQVVPEWSTFFSTVFIEQSGFDTKSDGDLWPCAWSNDDNLYAANGDGKGLDLQSKWADIVVSRIDGHPRKKNISGMRLSSGDAVGPVWGDTSNYNRKPTGMVSVNGVLYLAVQDLNKKHPHMFDDVPSSTIVRSDDKGKTWTWNKQSPMFTNHTFTTIMFLDYGKDGRDNTFDRYVYAYGIDYNWRNSYTDYVPDPIKLYLARIPADGLQNLGAWEFYTGDLQGNAQWSAPGDTAARKPVIHDERRRHSKQLKPAKPNHMSVISQGSVVYNKALNRYIYSSWASLTHEFYESPTPWGPWKIFLARDYGEYPWNDSNYGGYAPVIPSKYISDNGREMWVASSTFAGGVQHYNFSLRKLLVTPFKKTTPSNKNAATNLAAGNDVLAVTPISAANVRFGTLLSLNDGIRDTSTSVDSYSNEYKEIDYWGLTWPKTYNMNRLTFYPGRITQGHGGWFEDVQVEVRQNFRWVPVKNAAIVSGSLAALKTGQPCTFDFDATWGDGIRISGKPGGPLRYTSAAEIEVYFR